MILEKLIWKMPVLSMYWSYSKTALEMSIYNLSRSTRSLRCVYNNSVELQQKSDLSNPMYFILFYTVGMDACNRTLRGLDPF